MILYISPLFHFLSLSLSLSHSFSIPHSLFFLPFCLSLSLSWCFSLFSSLFLPLFLSPSLSLFFSLSLNLLLSLPYSLSLPLFLSLSPSISISLCVCLWQLGKISEDEFALDFHGISPFQVCQIFVLTLNCIQFNVLLHVIMCLYSSMRTYVLQQFVRLICFFRNFFQSLFSIKTWYNFNNYFYCRLFLCIFFIFNRLLLFVWLSSIGDSDTQLHINTHKDLHTALSSQSVTPLSQLESRWERINREDFVWLNRNIHTYIYTYIHTYIHTYIRSVRLQR